MDKHIFFIITILIVFGCSNEQKEILIPGKNLVLYANYFTNDGLFVVDLDSNKEYIIPEADLDAEYRFFNSNENLLKIYKYRWNGNYEIYNFVTNTVERKYLRLENNDWYYFYSSIKDSIIIYCSSKDVFIKNIQNKNRDKIHLDVDIIMSALANNNGDIAINYSDKGDKSDWFEYPKSLMFVNFRDKKIVKTEIKVSYLTDWSQDGKNLIFADSILKILKFPELTISIMEGISNDTVKAIPSVKFMNDSLVVFVGYNLNYISHDQQQLYLYDINKKEIIKRLTNRKGEKIIYDVYNYY